MFQNARLRSGDGQFDSEKDAAVGKTDCTTMLKLNLNGHSNKDPQRNPVFFNEKSSRVLEKKMRSLATRGLKGVRGLGVAELWIRSVG